MNIKILLVDDHEIMREGLCALLRKHDDIEIVGQASDGRAAVKKVDSLSPDVVVMDIGMPELNGVEATHSIRKKHPQTQVVILSVYSTTEHIRRAFHEGAIAYVLKESAGKEVIDAVRSAAAGRRYVSDKIADIIVEGRSHGAAEKKPQTKKNPGKS